MVITYLGKQFFKIQRSDKILAFNPIGKQSKHDKKVPNFGSDLVLITASHPDFNGVDSVSHGSKIPFVVDGPGDYEIGGVFIKGLGVGSNTVYSLSLDGMSVCFLGNISSARLEDSVREEIGAPDILFISIRSLGAAAAYNLSLTMEPKIIVPMDYDEKSLRIFLKESGGEEMAALEKLTVRKSDLEDKEGEIIVLRCGF